MSINVTGLASGFDWNSFVDQMVAVEQAPEAQLRTEQSTINQRKNAYSSIQTQLGVLNNSLTTLKDPTLFNSRLSQSSDTTVATGTASGGTALGQYKFDITQLATASTQTGQNNVGAALSATDDVSGVVLSNAAFVNPVTAGTFTVNGKQVTIATTDTLKQVFDKISTATGGSVTASYSSASDKITLSSSGQIVLGSATDSSNFLQLARLNNNGSGTITSSAALGSLNTTGPLANANLATAISDGTSGAGEFTINGVSITFNKTTDSLTNVIDRINGSAAGVTASYDSLNDRLVLTNKTTGDMGMALQDVTGNFLAATGLTSGTLQRGHDLLYTINGGGQLSSHSNTIDQSSSGLTGLAVTAVKEGTTTISVASDSATIKSAINSFIDAYNQVQSMIGTQTASSTDANGKVTAGILADEGDADDIASQVRGLANSPQSGLAGAIKSLDDLGIVSNGNDNTIALSDSSKLDAALANNLSSVEALFTDATNGIGGKLSNYLDKTIGDDGTLPAKEDNLTKQSSAIDTQIADMERLIAQDRQRMVDEFTAMETAQAQINQQLDYLTKSFGSSSSS